MNGSSLRGCRLVVEKARERNQVMPGRDQETDYQRKQDGGKYKIYVPSTGFQGIR